MKLKIAIALFFTAALFITASAQDITKCESDLKVLDEQVKMGNYADAAPLLATLREKCPKFSERIYANGEAMLKYDIEIAQTAEARRKGFDALAALYAQYNKSFPQNNSGTDIKYVMLLDQYKAIDRAELYKKLDAAFKKNPRAFTDYNAVEAYFLEYVKIYEAKDKGITQEQFIEKFAEIITQAKLAHNAYIARRDALQQKQLSQSLSDDEKTELALAEPAISGFEAVIDNINIMASKYFTCDKLGMYYEANFEANKTDAAWLQSVVEMLMSKKNKCYNTIVLQKSAEALHALKPSAQSAFYLGTLAKRNNKNAEAITYFEQSAKLEQTAEKKAERYYTVATILTGADNKQSKEYITRSLQMNPKSAEPYMLLAEMYISAGKECGLNDLDKKALYWLGIETLKKGEIADPARKATLAAMMQRYAKKVPTKDEAKAAGLKKGKKITFGCWINETITIPEL